MNECMKGTKLIRVVMLIMLGLLFCGIRASAESKDIYSAVKIQSYVKVDNNGDNPVPVLMLYDGKVLQEGVDYTLKLLEETDEHYINADEYTIEVSGIGDYSGSKYYLGIEYSGVEKTINDVKYLYNNDDYTICITEYIGDSDKVDFDDIYTYLEFDEIFAGILCDNDSVKEISLGWADLTDYLCVNCPNVTSIKTDGEIGYTVSGGKPGPLVAGELNGEVEIGVPIGFNWSYNDDNNEEANMSIEGYCSEYPSFVVVESSDSFQKDGWNYRIDETRGEAYIVSYKGEESDITCPQKVTYNEKEYNITSLTKNTFSGLSGLKTVDLGSLPIIDNLFKDCPNLKKVICKNRIDIELGDYIVSGNAPGNNELTISTYPDVEWDVYNDETNDYTTTTMEKYCEEHYYVFEPIKADYVDFTVSTEQSCLIAGSSEQLYVMCSDVDADDEYINVKDIDSSAEITEWEIISGKGAAVSSDGVLSASNEITKMTTIFVKCIVELEGQSIRATGIIDIYPRLTGTDNYIIVPPNATRLTCRQNTNVIEDEQVLTEALPTGTTVQFSIADENIIRVDNDGYAYAVEGATIGGSTTVTAVYTIDGKEYTYVYNVEIGEAQDISDISSEKIYIYGWKGSGFDKVIKEFTGLYPKLTDSIVYVELNTDDDWEEYKTGINNAINYEDNKPDIVLWPENKVYENLSNNYLVDLESIGFDTQGKYANAFPYTKMKGTWNDKLYAATHEINPGCFIYKKDIAKEVLGNDDAETVQNAVKDWDSFMKTAAVLKEHEYYMTNAMNLEYPLFGGKTEPWIVDNVMNLEKTAKQYIDLQKQLYVNGYIQENCNEWDYPDDSTGSLFTNDCFGYFIDYKTLYDMLNKGQDKDAYGICQGPVPYEISDTVYMTVTNTNHNNPLVSLFLQETVSNTSIMKNSMKNNNGLMNNITGLNNAVNDDPFLSVLSGAASSIPAVAPGIYDDKIEELLTDYDIVTWSDSDDITVAEIEKKDIDTLLKYIKRDCTSILPDTITVDRIIEENPEVEDPEVEDPEVEDPEVKDPEVENPEKDDPVPAPISPAPGNDNQEKTIDDKADAGSNKPSPTPVATESNAAAVHTHQYSEWVIVTDATCDEKGLKQRTCSGCGNVETEEIPATGFVKGGTFIRNDISYKILSVKGKKGTLSLTGLKKNKSKVTVPEKIKAGGITFTVTAIADRAFKDNAQLKTVIISKNVTKIGKSAFENCKNLKSVTIKSVKLTKKSFGSKAFKKISNKAKFRCPKKILANYKKWIRKAGAPKKAKIS